MALENETSQTEKYSRLKDLAVITLLSTPNIADAAKAVGVSESTMYRWMEKEDFLDSLREARQQAIKIAMAQLQQCTGNMIKVLSTIAEDKKAPYSARVSAASKLLDSAIRITEDEEIIARLKRLELAIK